MIDTRARGDIAEAAVLHALTAAGLLVLVPFGRFGPYDLVAEVSPGDFVRIQVKSGRVRNGCVEFNCCGTDHGNGPGSYAGRADVFAVHVHETGEQYVVPVDEAPTSKMYLRTRATANNQSANVRFAARYELKRWLSRNVTTTQTGRAP
ncbi:MAG TPA: group I intron-associated PD-(D/E)XK endonuclease [Solirubrobacteraceae bacterium]